MSRDLLSHLNEPQRQAVCHVEGPLLIIAGAGSGKTRVVTHRIAYLIAIRAARPQQILGVTFTNKAAGEMKQRVIDLLGPVARHVWLSTFHSFCAAVLRRHPEAIGYRPGFTIYDEDDSLALIKRVTKSLGIPEAFPSPGLAQRLISRAKDKLIGPEQYAATASDPISQNVARIYAAYQEQLRKNNAFDFDDLLGKVVELFDRWPEQLARYQDHYRFVLVDEYQDTNHAQARLVQQLAGRHRNICVVGDDDQSIYGWRGAEVGNILDFDKAFPACRVIYLEQNYRSTKFILEAAHDVVEKLAARKPKKLFTQRPGGEKVVVLECADERDEALAVAAKIRAGLADGQSPADFAILYRTNAQSRAIEEALRDHGIPYLIVGGIRFYERREIKDILAYMRLLVNPHDDESLLRIINVPKRGVGEASVKRLVETATKTGRPLLQVLADPTEAGVKGTAAAELVKLHKMITGLAAKVDSANPAEITALLIDQTDYLEMLRREDTPEADVRADNVNELVNAVVAYLERAEEDPTVGPPTLAGFLENVALITDIDLLPESAEAVHLMTLHSAKGLEFDTVFITGLEDGLFPLIRDDDDEESLEEERRLCYVGMTRARNRLYLCFANFRRRHNSSYLLEPSRFLFDIREDLLEFEVTDVRGIEKGASSAQSRTSTTGYLEPNTIAPPGRSPNKPYALGATVIHDIFGPGVIVGCEGSGETAILKIRFGHSTKKIMANHGRLRPAN